MTATLPIAAWTVDLTPGTPVPMGGHQGPDRLTLQSYGRLEANILVLGQGLDSVVIVSVDTLFIGASLTTAIMDACRRRFGVGPERVLALASHSHSAPMLDESKPGLGRADADELARWAGLIEKSMQPVAFQTAASIRVGRTTSDLSVNRRLRWRWPTLARLLGKTPDDIYICDNPAGPRDPRIRTAVWLSPDGQALAALWSFACHPTAFPLSDTASADYIGVVRGALRRSLGEQIPVIFAPGCMGDVRPRSPAPWLTLARLPGVLVYGPQASPYDLASWEAWAGELGNQVLAAHAAGEARPLEDRPEAAPMERLPLSALFDGSAPVPEFHAKAVRLPGLGRLVALSCEPVSDVAALLGANDADMVLGYEGDVFGYLPTEAQIEQGGYEARRFMTSFGLAGRFRSDLDKIIADVGRKLLSRI